MSDGIPTDMHAFNQQVIEQFRASGGRGTLGPVTFENLILLTTTGRRSAQPRTVPLGYVRDTDGNYVLFGSNMGSPREPDWCLNISSDARVSAEVTGASWPTIAVITEGAEREAAYRLWTEANPGVADHQDRAGRTIPMVLVPPE